ncbi:uncharacterized protein LOC130749832 [Lotus japonicus]|uniref:uncharacterized protein LOC130749832 n=1 Tax=Lotus japonicus TaxID=34305 RepID=UPI0025869DCA|nr:uncharacterized protein LOC130749832 [Lotus japonicus]
MGQSNNGNFPANLPVLDGKNWDRWRIQMKVIMGFQEVIDIVENGYPGLPKEPTDAQRKAHQENKKKDCKALFLLHQCVDVAHFEKISGAANSSEAWKILEKINEGAEQLKKVKLQTMRRKYELLQMESTERIADFFNRIISLTNLMKACGEKITDQSIVEKVLRTLTPKFDHIVVAIEESKKLENIKVEELQGSLEAHEQRLIERSTEKSTDQALQASTSKKGGFQGKGGFRGKGKGRDYKSNSSINGDSQEKSKTDGDQSSESSSRRGGSNHYRGGRKKFDRKKIRCFNCNKIGHFSAECKALSQEDHQDKHGDEANLVQMKVQVP